MKGSAQPHLEQVFQQRLRPQAASSPGDERGKPEQSLPAADSDYSPYRISNAPEFSLVCIKSDGTMRGFQYVHLDSDSDFAPDGQSITLRFMGLAPWQVTVEGRNLRELFDYLHQHRIPYIREAAEAFADDDEEIITKITLTPLKIVKLQPDIDP